MRYPTCQQLPWRPAHGAHGHTCDVASPTKTPIVKVAVAVKEAKATKKTAEGDTMAQSIVLNVATHCQQRIPNRAFLEKARYRTYLYTQANAGVKGIGVYTNIREIIEFLGVAKKISKAYILSKRHRESIELISVCSL